MTAIKFASPVGARVQAYRRLLLNEWDDDFPDRVLNLLWSCVSHGSGDLDTLLDPKQAMIPAKSIANVVASIVVGSKFLRVAGLPKLPADYRPPTEIEPIDRQVLRLATYLTLQANARLSGNDSLFRDAQALAFQAAVHVTLPKLGDEHAAERSILLHALALFAAGLFGVDPAHSAYLTSALYGVIGDSERRLRFLHESFRFTSPDDHSFLTKAQEYWMELLDRNRHKQAQEFVLSLASRAQPEQRDEVRAMMAGAFSHPASPTP